MVSYLWKCHQIFFLKVTGVTQGANSLSLEIWRLRWAALVTGDLLGLAASEEQWRWTVQRITRWAKFAENCSCWRTFELWSLKVTAAYPQRNLLQRASSKFFSLRWVILNWHNIDTKIPLKKKNMVEKSSKTCQQIQLPPEKVLQWNG